MACVGIQQTQARRLIKGQNRLILRVDRRQRWRQRAQQRDGSGLIVDENSSLAASGNFTLHDHLVSFRLNPVFLQQTRHPLFIGFKHAAHHGLFRTMANHVRGSFVA